MQASNTNKHMHALIHRYAIQTNITMPTSKQTSKQTNKQTNLVVDVDTPCVPVVDGATVDDRVGIVLDLHSRYPIAVNIVLFKKSLD